MALHKKLLEKLRVRRPDEFDDDGEHYASAQELIRQGRPVEALSEFKKALQASERVPETHLALGHLYEQLERPDDAIQAFTQAIKANPELAEAYTAAGLAYDRAGEFLKAVRMHLKAMRLSPQNFDLRMNLGNAYFNVGSYPEATRAYEQALEIEPENTAAHYALALVYLDLENKVAAREQWEAIKRLGDSAAAEKLADEIDRQSLRSSRMSADGDEPFPDTVKEEPTPLFS